MTSVRAGIVICPLAGMEEENYNTGGLFDQEQLEIFHLNDAFNVVAYSVMSLGKKTSIHHRSIIFLCFSWHNFELNGSNHGWEEG